MAQLFSGPSGSRVFVSIVAGFVVQNDLWRSFFRVLPDPGYYGVLIRLIFELDDEANLTIFEIKVIFELEN